MALPGRLLTRPVLLTRESLFLCGLAATPRLPDRIHTHPRFYDNAISCAQMHGVRHVCILRYPPIRICARVHTKREERFNNFASPSLLRYVSPAMLIRERGLHCYDTANNDPSLKSAIQPVSKIIRRNFRCTF